MERTPCKFYPPRLLRTHKEDGSTAVNGLDEAASIRNDIDRLQAKLAAIQRGEQWQQHVQSSAFTSLVARSAVAAMLSPEQAPPPSSSNSSNSSNGAAAHAESLVGSLPSPAAAIEAAAGSSSSFPSSSSPSASLSIDVSAAVASSSPSMSPLSAASTPAADHLADSMELLATSAVQASAASSSAAVAASSASSGLLRPISPLTECHPSSATADAAMPLQLPSAAAGAATARCATPPVAPSAASPCANPSSAMSVDDQHLCKVCFVSEINTVLLPCAHVAVCLECSTQLQRCCICRANITDAIQTFKA